MKALGKTGRGTPEGPAQSDALGGERWGWVVCPWERECSGVLGCGGVTCLCGFRCVYVQSHQYLLSIFYVPLGTVLGDGDATANKTESLNSQS